MHDFDFLEILYYDIFDYFTNKQTIDDLKESYGSYFEIQDIGEVLNEIAGLETIS